MYEFIQTETGWVVCFGPAPKELRDKAAAAAARPRVTPAEDAAADRKSPEPVWAGMAP
jgi:hypothetical protein